MHCSNEGILSFQSVDHDRAAGIHAKLSSSGSVDRIRIGDVECEMETTLFLFPVDAITTLRGFVVTLSLFRPDGLTAQRDAIYLQGPTVLE